MWHRISWHRFWSVWCKLFFDHIFFLNNVLSSVSTYQCGSNGTRMRCAWETKNFWISGPFGNVYVIPDFFASVWGYKEHRINVSSPGVLRCNPMTAQPILWSWYFLKKVVSVFEACPPRFIVWHPWQLLSQILNVWDSRIGMACPTWRKPGPIEVFSMFVFCLKMQKCGYTWLKVLNTSHLNIFNVMLRYAVLTMWDQYPVS